MRNPGPDSRSDVASVTAGFTDLHIEEQSHDLLYPTVALSSSQYESSQAEASSYNARQYDVTQPAASTSYSSFHGCNPRPIVPEADHYGSTQTHLTSDYHSARASDPTAITPTHHPEPFDPIQTDHATAYYYPAPQKLLTSPQFYTPAAPTYSSPQRGMAVVNTRQQTNSAARRNEEAQQRLDESFAVRNHDYKKFFRVGRVFMTLWHGPLGSGANEYGSLVSQVIFGEKVYSKVRRFIVVRQSTEERSATCLPITSYGGNGQGKSGIKREEHGFIYSRREPKRVSGMCSKALRVILDQNAQHLTDPSLVHYGKVHTVETNWKVKTIGVLDDNSIKTLLHYWRKVFGFVKDDLPEPGMTPHAMEAALAYVGAGRDSYPAAPSYETYLSTTTDLQNFATTSAAAGYQPPTPRESYGGDRGSAEPNQARTPAQGTASYQGYSVAMAPGRTVSTVIHPSQGPSTTDHYGQHSQQYNATNPQTAGDNQSTTSSGYADT
jgi:hypothetical protein